MMLPVSNSHQSEEQEQEKERLLVTLTTPLELSSLIANIAHTFFTFNAFD